MAALIAKIVRRGNDGHYGYAPESSSHRRKSNSQYTKFPEPSATGKNADRGNTASPSFGNEVRIDKGDNESDIQLATYPGDNGIMKTVTTVVVTENDKEHGSSSSVGQEQENPRHFW